MRVSIRLGLLAGFMIMVSLLASVVALRQRSDPAEDQASGARTYETALVTVDAGVTRGLLNNPAAYHNQAGPSAPLGPADARLVRDLKPVLTRVWSAPGAYHDPATDRYDYDPVAPDGGTMYGYLDQATAYSGRILMNVDQCEQELMTTAAPQRCREVLKNGIRHYKQRYPALRYVEIFNEPDRPWETRPDEARAMSAAEYYEWYRIGYQLVNEINAELRPVHPLRVGGPVTHAFNEPYLQEFLDHYRDDPDPTKRLDFLSYHQYQRRDDVAAVATEKGTVQRWLRERGLPDKIPTFVTEYGVFPGGNTGTSFAADLLTQAAAMATLGYFYVEGGTDVPMHWVFNHSSNDRKSMFVDGTDGAGYPYYNLVRMQRMLKKIRVSAGSDALTPKGLGVNALATRDASGVAVLITNYQWTSRNVTHGVTVNVGNLPAEFANRRIRVERYLVDAVTSNYAHDPAKGSLQRVQRYTMDTADAISANFELGPNAMSLLVLTPVE
ncbi:hypothetical protein [Micromonospora sp. RTGN7]|uniref:hypothetical protein n=1 Tax=Micromonospora sp. RTGN7 TaxID=3016526 RepID=UPI0029FF4C02|nr:hypothetical protein [Micromonospora sp. RTGN7]